MDQAISRGLQNLDLRELAIAVIGPLKCGLRSFINVSEILLSVNGDIILPGCQTFNDIRKHIENMMQEMQQSEDVAKTELQHIDRETERLTAEQSYITNQKIQAQSDLQYFRSQLDSHRTSLRNYEEALETERRNLRSAEETLQNLRWKREEAERVRNAGIGVFFIPIVGWIAGAVMVGVGETEMNQASDAVNRVNDEIRNSESQVRYYSDKVSEIQSSIYRSESAIQDADNRIYNTECKLRDVSAKRAVIADVQAKMRKAVHQVGLLAGVGSVAELQTRCLILMKPVMVVMEEMTNTLGQITGDELLHTEGIKSLMNEIRMNEDKLKQLAGTESSDIEYI